MLRRQSHVRTHRIIRRGCHARRAQKTRPANRRRHLKRSSRRGGRRPCQGGPLRKGRRARGLPRGPLRARSHDHLGPGDPQDAQAQGHEVRHRHHRALQEARDLRRGGDDRDVPGRRVHQEDRGRLRDTVGVERVGGNGVEPKRQGVRGRRGMEEQTACPQIPLRLRRRHLPQEELGRLLRERGRHGGHRRQRRRLPRGDRRRRGPRRAGRVLEGAPLVAQGAAGSQASGCSPATRPPP